MIVLAMAPDNRMWTRLYPLVFSEESHQAFLMRLPWATVSVSAGRQCMKAVAERVEDAARKSAWDPGCRPWSEPTCAIRDQTLWRSCLCVR